MPRLHMPSSTIPSYFIPCGSLLSSSPSKKLCIHCISNSRSWYSQSCLDRHTDSLGVRCHATLGLMVLRTFSACGCSHTLGSNVSIGLAAETLLDFLSVVVQHALVGPAIPPDSFSDHLIDQLGCPYLQNYLRYRIIREHPSGAPTEISYNV